MAAGSAIRAGRAFVELFLDDSKMVRGLKSAARRLKMFGASVRSIGVGLFVAGAGIATPLIAATKQFASTGDKLDKMSKRTGFAVETLSKLGFAAEQSGASLEQFDRAAAAMARFALQADRGLSTATDVLDKLGISTNDFLAKSPEDKFLQLASAIADIADPTLRAGVALQVFGRQGRELLPLLNGGSQAIAELMAEAERLGLVISTEDAVAAADFTDALQELWSQIKAVTFAIGAPIAKAFTRFIRSNQDALAEVIAWTKENGDLVKGILKLTAGLLAFAGAVVALGATIQFTGFALAGFVTLTTALGATLAFIAANPVTIALVAVGAALAGVAAYVFDAVVGFEHLSLALTDFAGFSALVAGRFQQAWIDAVARVSQAAVQLRGLIDPTLPTQQILFAIEVAANFKKAAIEQRIKDAQAEIDAAAPDFQRQLQQLNKAGQATEALKQRSGLQGTFSGDARQFLFFRPPPPDLNESNLPQQQLHQLQNINNGITRLESAVERGLQFT